MEEVKLMTKVVVFGLHKRFGVLFVVWYCCTENPCDCESDGMYLVLAYVSDSSEVVSFYLSYLIYA